MVFVEGFEGQIIDISINLFW